MWADAERLRALANLLLGLSALWVLWSWASLALHSPAFALHAVELQAVPAHVTRGQLQEVVQQVNGNFFTVDLQRTRQQLEQLPWVRQAGVRRKFPWALQIELEEHVALARWNQGDLINTHGEVFHAATEQKLPQFVGEAHNAQLVAQRYAELNLLLQPLHRQIACISLSPRLAWQIELDDGLQVALGREETQARLARFVRVYPAVLATAMPGARAVDLRYRNGFAAAMPGAAS